MCTEIVLQNWLNLLNEFGDSQKTKTMEEEREKEDETLFKKYFEEKEIEFMFPPETASEMQHQRNINIAKVSYKVYDYVIIELTLT